MIPLCNLSLNLSLNLSSEFYDAARA